MNDSEKQGASISWLSILRRIGLASILLVFLPVLCLGLWLSSFALSVGPETKKDNVVVTIPRGSSLQDIRRILAEQRIIFDDVRFLLLAKLTGYANRLPSGEFLLDTGRKPVEVLSKLASARSIQYSITIQEGLRAADIASIFAEGGWFDPRSFANLVVDKEFMAKHGLTGLDSLEGYLFPDTYILTRDTRGAEKIMALMIGRFHRVWGELTAQLGEKPDREKTLILASMVEKETGAPAERPVIAGVFYNRLQLGMRLQSDPTVVYGLVNYSGKITKNDLQSHTPYNTYVIPGLPAGPICNPGKEALRAVLFPAATKDIYFVAKNDGTHHFSATLVEHNRAVDRYQRKKSDTKGR